MRERNRIEQRVAGLAELERTLGDAVAMQELAEAEGDEAMVTEGIAELGRLRDVAERRRVESLLAGEADANDAFLEIHAGAGGTEAQDWGQMLLRMYMRWAERNGYQVGWVQETPGEEAGIKSATVRITGTNAYGWLC